MHSTTQNTSTMSLVRLAARTPWLAVAVHLAHGQSVCTENCQNSCSQQTFSACTGVDCTNTVTGSVATCQGALFGDASSVTCAGGACQNAQMEGSSTVSCTGTDTCKNAMVNQSKIDCLDSACESALFIASAVFCEEYFACSGSTFFQACTCCDGYSSNCGGTTSCMADPIGFCSSTFLGRTCAEWGNPVCSAYDIPASGNAEVTECRGGDCVSGIFKGESIWCDNKNNGASTPTCQSSTFTNSRVECEAGSCTTSSFFNSEVRCLDTLGGTSCDQSIFNRSSVQCYDEACQSAVFYSSALYCDPYFACASFSAFSCSCCDGYDSTCEGLPSCEDDLVGFCSSKFLGRTCKDWGNPVCSSISVDEESVAVTICDKGNCASSSFNGTSVFCNNKSSAAVPATCESTAFQNSLVYCIAGACRNSDFDSVDVVCVEGRGDSDSCASSTFHQSKVGCYDSGCDSSVFESSEVICDGYVSCASATFDDCSCCDGNGCPSEIPSCTVDSVSFCSGREMNGVTCAALGNPICKGLGGPTMLPVATPNPPTPRPPAETTSSPALVVTPVPASPIRLPTEATGAPALVVMPVPASTDAPTSSFTDSPSLVDADTPGRRATDLPTFLVTRPAAQTTSGLTVHTNCSGVNEVTAVSGIQVSIPSCAEDASETTITTWPRNGSVTVHDNGSVRYTPNVGFVGLDVIGVKTCKPAGDCFDATVNVDVSAPEEILSPESDSGGSYAYLAALVVIPIVGCVAGYLLYKRKKTESSNAQWQGSGPSFKQGGSVNITALNESISGPSFSLYEGAGIAHQTPSQAVPPQYPGNTPGRPSSGGNVPTFKDQVQTVDPQRPAIAAGHQPGCDDGGGEGAVSSRPRQDPPTEPRHVNAVAKPMPGRVAPADYYEPHVKDQCRNVAEEGMNNSDPPLASAVVVEETIEQVAPDLPRINL